MPPASAHDLTRGSESRQLLSLTIPMLFGVSSSILVTTIEIGFIGQLGTTALAGIAFTFPITMAMMSIISGIGIGCSSVIARRIGAGAHDDARRLSGHGLLLALLFGASFASVAWLGVGPLIRSMGATSTAHAIAVAYMSIYLPGVVLFALTMVAGSVMRAAGDARMPGYVMTAAAFVNLALDPVLIFGWFGVPALGVEGAAWAISISRGLSAVVLLIVLSRRRLASWASGFARSTAEIMAVAVPAMATQLIGPISAAIITALLASHGEAIVAGFGVASRIESVAIMFLFALSGSIGPFLGQNFGAGRIDRVRAGLAAAYRFCLLLGLAACAALFAIRGVVVPLFDDNPAAYATAMSYLAIVPVSYGVWGVLMMASAAFNALGKPIRSTILSFVRMFVIYVPIAWWANQHWGYQGIFVATAFTNTLMGAVGFWWLRQWLLEQGDPEKDP